MTIIGGGAIGCELAQGFTRLGTKCTIVQMDDFLIPNGGKETGDLVENVSVGYVKVFTNSLGRVFGVKIVGDGSGEMINEWALIVQKKIRLHSVMFLAHSFPTMGFLSKRVAEKWMMEKMKSSLVRKLCGFFYRKL